MTNNRILRKHNTPGIYTTETEILTSNTSVGGTSAGLVGETLKGPAFQQIQVEDWKVYQEIFGGISTEKFKGSQYPKYELPFIAKSFLEASKRLTVVRVLGLSGANAGPAWLITASKYNEDGNLDEDSQYKNTVIGVLRSRGSYLPASLVKSRTGDECDDTYEFDKLQYFADEVYLENSTSFALNSDCIPKFANTNETAEINSLNKGRFTIVVKTTSGELKRYPVSLNSGEKNYIYNVLGYNATDGNSEVYVEELYDVALQQLIEQGEINQIDYVNAPNSLSVENFQVVRKDGVAIDRMVYLPNVKVMPKYKDVDDLLTLDESVLGRQHLGKRYLFSKEESLNRHTSKPLRVHVSENEGLTWVEQEGQVGHIYTVIAYTTKTGKREYYYGEYVQKIGATPKQNVPQTKGKFLTEALGVNKVKVDNKNVINEAVEVKSDNAIFVLQNDEVYPITLDINNYKEGYRNAMTPWFVSEVKGNGQNIELTKLFRLHTITDGDVSNTEIKCSIENIDPTNGTFTLVIRQFYDSDTNPIKLEVFRNCSLNKRSKNYLGSMIGTIDGSYRQRSKYVIVEISENDNVETSVPCGFLGYPIRDYNGLLIGNGDEKKPALTKPFIKFNTFVDSELRHNKQYFGSSDLVGIDEDVLKYKGVEAYNGLPQGLTPSFHLDSRILNGKLDADNFVENEDKTFKQKVTVDGIEGYEWVTVSKNQTTSMGIEPRIGGADVMYGTIYENSDYRKFTTCFYGGFDGWDYFRSQRTNTDEFKYNQYKGSVDTVTGYGDSFGIVKNRPDLKFKTGYVALTTDYYAYLAGIREFANPNMSDISLFATPGIDLHNQKLLVNETVEMIEEERGKDCLYVVTTPDKPNGAGESVGSMFSAQDVIDLVEESNIDSSCVATYYPWLRYGDTGGRDEISLPQTRDVLRAMALTDTTSFPWIASTGFQRGLTTAVDTRMHLKTEDTDQLHMGRINYVVSFPNEGLRLWGDRNLSKSTGLLNRISKRRLMIEIGRQIKRNTIGLIFEPNDSTTVKAFEQIIANIMTKIMSNRGINAYKLEIDRSNEAIENLTLYANLFIQPIPNLEFIEINFVITPQGISLV